MIYFIRTSRKGAIKIGFTSKGKVGPRLVNLQVACPTRLRVLAFYFGCKKQEAFLHRRFEYARRRGEWYAPVPELLDHIDRMRGTKHPHRKSLVGDFLRRHGIEGSCRGRDLTVPALRKLAELVLFPQSQTR